MRGRLRWDWKYGDKLDFLTDVAKRKRVPLLESRPSIPDAFSPVWAMFTALVEANPGAGRFPLSELVAYFEIAGIDDPMTRLLYTRLIRDLCKELREIAEEERKKKEDQ